MSPNNILLSNCTILTHCILAHHFVAEEHHIQLDYRPVGYNGVTCSSSHIIIAEEDDAAVHIHSWSANHIQRISRRELNLQGEYICGVQYIAQDHTLLLAEGPMFAVTHLHAYKVSIYCVGFLQEWS